MLSPTLTFLGAAGTVTGSRYLTAFDGHPRVLVDCGLFQGFKVHRSKNWQPLPFDPASLDAVVLTHAHIDHSGYLPALARDGFRGPIHCTEATRDLCELLLPDSGRLQELDAEYANRKGYSKHHPALPLYTEADAVRVLGQLRPAAFDARIELGSGLYVTFHPAGHILGAAMVRLVAGELTVTFSGDVGRYEDVLMPPPDPLLPTDYLIVESTYGDRVHDKADPQSELAGIVGRTIDRGGTVVVPAFAVGRTQTLLLLLHRLFASGRLPPIPVFVDSPLASAATRVYRRHARLHRLAEDDCLAACELPTFVRDAEASKALAADPRPKIIISASGMATGGRVLHHLEHYLPDRRSTVLLTGFQAGGTRGATLAEGAQLVKIHGEYVPVHAEVAMLDSLSAHADAQELVRWMGSAPLPPRRTFITHGEPHASDKLRTLIEERLGWSCIIPDFRDEYVLAFPQR